jgi:hypothetical protein
MTTTTKPAPPSCPPPLPLLGPMSSLVESVLSAVECGLLSPHDVACHCHCTAPGGEGGRGGRWGGRGRGRR